ncbi:PstS family phosphate ABC transporter substrate-binding protein [Nocardioides sp. SR21]|uniref:PstS family phosphate ABC transporter substrate-binding protein n=1 Tax=Nocardioides sp. SR21 TaxID=2919501 RepID=UPI001FA99237|nr:substrate-binding domain-containing protein [Nocardioides sp. SR21]
MSRRQRLFGSLAACAVGLSLVTACSDPADNASDSVSQDQAANFRDEQAQLQEVQRAHDALPDRPSGVVSIDGSTGGSLTAYEVGLYESTPNAAEIQVADNGEDQAFQELCSGQIDLVDSARPISRAEWEACQAVGLDVVQFQVAAEAIVIAIKSETDVGADCLSVDQVRDLYRAGSPLTNWSQPPLGFDDVPLKVGGPSPENNGFGFFGRYVLDAPEPSQVDLRSDYFLAQTDEEARRFVVGNPQLALRASRFDDVSRRRAQADQAVQDARNELLAAKEELAIALAEREKGIRDERSAADKAKDQARVDKAYPRLSDARIRYNRVKDRFAEWDHVYNGVSTARRLYAGYRGHVAYFRFSYYNLFEDQLRPFEITDSNGQVNCIFPSQRTIVSGEYPLARQLLITTTTDSLQRGEVRDFLTHYLRNAQEAAAEARLVPLTSETVDLELAWLTGDQAPLLVAPDDDATAPAQPVQSEKPAR